MTVAERRVHAWIQAIRDRLAAVNPGLNAFRPRRSDPDDHRDVAAMVLTGHSLTLIWAATEMFETNRHGCGATLVRGVYEAAVKMRWCLASSQNAARWFKAGETETYKALANMGRVMQAAGRPTEQSPPLPPRPSEMVGEPETTKTARQVGLGDFHDAYYGMLSTFAHANFMMAAPTYRGDDIPEDHPHHHTLGLLVPALYVTDDVARVFESWARSSTIAPPVPFATFVREQPDR